MKKNKLNIVFALLAAFTLVSCNDSDDFSNKAYVAGINRVQTILIKPSVVEETKSLEVNLPKPAEKNLIFKVKVDKSKVSVFNQSYQHKAILLPESHYTINNSELNIFQGALKSEQATILFNDIFTLDSKQEYVLPVTIDSEDINLIKGSKTTYYYFKGAALINVVADIEKNFLKPEWKNPDVVNELPEMTLEALIRVKNFNENIISTVMGIENYFLIRIGDANFPRNQLQLSILGIPYPEANPNKGLPTNVWTHIAVTLDKDRNLITYINGKEQDRNTSTPPFSFGRTFDGREFFIGYSWAADRWLAGDICECRIWNIARTQEDIANTIYGVNPDSEGLMAYWKFDEGAGNIVYDHTGNENHLKSNKDLVWKEVSLPAPEK